MNDILLRDRFRVLETVGRGGQGEVHRAADLLHDRQVAVKVRRLTDSDREQVLAEARVLFSLTPHPNLAVLREDHVLDGHYFLVMDWVGGESLAKRLSGGSVPYLESIEILKGIAAALDHLHAHVPPVVHADVKPANVIVSPEGRAILVDFGLAGIGRSGTPEFQAPESARGALTAAADIYGLAATAHTLLTGAPPEPGSLPPLDVVPAPLRERVLHALRRGLSFDPRHRPRSAMELVALLSPTKTPTNIPAAHTSFVGRGEELVSLRDLVEDARLVTLLGPGGVGKTRLARELAGALLHRFPDGVRWTELAPIAGGSGVADAVSLAVAARGAEDDPLSRTIAEIRDRHVLLVLDNAEHILAEAGRTAAGLLAACPNLHIVTTSREPLGLPGEAVFDVPVLRVPNAGAPLHVIEDAEAVRLFSERARPRVRLAGPQWAIVARICARLDGLPLAIEMAAPHATMGLVELDRALEQRFAVLEVGPGMEPRHRTLQAAIDWSYDLLSHEERDCLCALGVFAGAFDEEAASTVCGLDDAGRVLTSLGAKSMVQVHQDAETERYTLLASIRAYALERLRDTGIEEEVRERHFEHFVGIARVVAPEVITTDPEHRAIKMAATERLYERYEDGRAALWWGLEHARNEDALRLATAMVEFVLFRGSLGEARRWFDAAIEANDGVRSQLMARALDYGTYVHTDKDKRRRLVEKAIPIYEEMADDPLAQATLYSLRASIADTVDERVGLFELARDMYLEAGIPGLAAMESGSLGKLEYRRGNLLAARSHYEKIIEWSPEGGSGPNLGRIEAFCDLGAVARRLGDLAEAERLIRLCLEGSRQRGSELHEQHSLRGLGYVALERGEYDEARDLFDRALQIARDRDDMVNDELFGCALAELMRGDPERARPFVDELIGMAVDAGDDDTPAEVALARAWLASSDGQIGTARDQFDNLIGTQPVWWLETEALRGAAEAALLRGDGGAARSYLQRAVDVAPPDAAVELARTCDLMTPALCHTEDHELAAHALGVADSIYGRTGAARHERVALLVDDARRDLMSSLGSHRLAEAAAAAATQDVAAIAPTLRVASSP